ncbi:MAG: DivIVA domain-containing protein [Mycobacteriaceae bacterium]
MTTLLQYFVITVVVAGVLFFIVSAVFGRTEELPALPKGTTATALPADDVTGADIDAVLFQQSFRGYKTSEVDWVLNRLAREIDLLRNQLKEQKVGDSRSVESATFDVLEG